MIVVDKSNLVVGFSHMIERVNAQNESNLIKVYTDINDENMFYYIGTIDRDDYVITDANIPDETKNYLYIDNQFIIIEEEL